MELSSQCYIDAHMCNNIARHSDMQGHNLFFAKQLTPGKITETPDHLPASIKNSG